MICRTALAAFLVLCPAFAYAADCRKAKDEAGMEACQNSALAGLDETITGQEKTLGERYAGEDDFDARLAAAHQAFVQFRAADCEMATFESRDGSGYASIRAACLVERTEKRVAALARMIDNP